MGLRGALLPLLVAVAPAVAQEPPAPAGPAPVEVQEAPGEARSAILTIDVDRLIGETRFGQGLDAALRAQTEALAAENERLRQALTAEEQALTERRPTMEVDAFRAEAEAFDARVQRIRAEQDAKQRSLEEAVARGRQDFLNAVTPVLARLMVERGAVAILERRDVFLSASVIDVTTDAVAAIDAQIGEGPRIGGGAEDGAAVEDAGDAALEPVDPVAPPATDPTPSGEGADPGVPVDPTP